MISALVKKQMMEVFAWVYRNGKTGKNRSKNGVIAYSIFNLFIFAFLGFMFFFMGKMLCGGLVSIGLGWLYLAIMGLVAVALGVFGSVFSTYSSLYLAKDNDLLLSMPIHSSKILAVRMLGVYIMGLIYELIVMIPALIVYFLNSDLNILSVIFSLIIPVILSFFVLSLSCVLGWIVAYISSKLKQKNIITVILSLVFIAGYYYAYSRAYALMQGVIENADEIANKTKSYLFLFYHMGRAGQGNILSLLIFLLITAVIFLIVYAVLEKSFINIATVSKSNGKVKYKGKKLKGSSLDSALLKKELRRFLGSPTYMLNCGLGIVIMPIAAVILLIKGDFAVSMMSEILGTNKEIYSLVVTAAVCMLTSMYDISAPSVSLEGKNLWILQVLPVSPLKALNAKIKLHLMLASIPVIFLTICAEIVIKPVWYMAILTFVTVIIFTLLTALTGLALNLKMPNLKWTAEAIPIKQSLPVTISLFGGWVLVIVLCIVYALLMRFISPVVYLLIISIVMASVCIVIYNWIRTKGTKIFEAL